ncbi:AMP-binding domain-containing protein [Pochonia chlamydosporia 170]|uniref:AMP-binding domain-containing protein n=1 Tax=Pochonia chlamydosporia 170 TaxID=1380566 RepID=A0A179FY89_METCM|nr:AMP-binding domain-containing protein [Pochonia chlamydosporia 170]OAQ70013.1 AMP-binding domain-containing protein [Pochonia chlamydosporia 170]
MADFHPELQAKLDDLQHELEEGDITEKGFQKRRALLLSQYGYGEPSAPTPTPAIHEPPPPPRSGLRLHQPDDSPPQQPYDGHRASTYNSVGGNGSDPDSPAYRTNSAYGPPPTGSHTSEVSPAGLLRPGGPIAERPVPVQRDSLFLTTTAASSDVPSRSETMVSKDYAFNPDQQGAYMDAGQHHQQQQFDGRTRTLQDSQGYFSDFAGQQHYDQTQPGGDYGAPHRYSSGEAFSPTAAMPPPMLTAGDLPPPEALEYLRPLEPREIPFSIRDPHDPNILMSQFDNLAAVLRHRARTTAKLPAYWVLDNKGKEIASITWDKLASRAEKVAQVIRDKSSLYRGDRVALVYRDSEIIDFAIALMGCFIAGVVAVPINDLQDYQRLNYILTSTQAHLALTTDNNLKAFQRDITAQKLTWPKGVEWWKTNEFGSYHPKKKEDIPALSVPDLAYIEFSRAPTGDLRGVVMSHRTIMHQMACLSAVISDTPGNRPGDTFNPSLRDKNGLLIGGKKAASEILLSYLEPRQGIGMIIGVLLTVYGGHTAVWFDNKAVDVPGLYAHLITRYKATVLVADYPGLKRAAYNYQQDPMTTRNFKKGMEPNFQSVKLCLIDTLTVDGEFHEVLADRWLRPLRNARARQVVAPMLCLPEHGGMVVSVRDWLGGEERMGVSLKLERETTSDSDSDDNDKTAKPVPSNGFGSLLGGGTTTKTEKSTGNTEMNEVLLDREALKTNEVVVMAYGAEVAKKAPNEPGMVRVGTFGYPIPDATLAVVDPETGLLASPHTVGEIWVDSPSLSGGFWSQPRSTELIFHARPYKFDPGDPTPTPVEPEFLRTGLLGTVIEGKIFILGLYEDRIRQKVEWVEHGHEVAEYRYFFVQHMVVSIVKNVPKIYDCSAFDVFVNDEHLPVVVVESAAASTAPLTSGGPPRQPDTALLDSLAERCMEVLMEEHHLRLYCVMITAPNSLPRVIKNGRREIGNMLCRREYDLGNLPCVHVKFGVEHAVLNLPIGVDPIGGIWSQIASESRANILAPADKQYSGIDRREVVIDDRTSTPLNNFACITDLIQWRVARQPEELSYCTIDGRGREGKGITWRKFDQRVAAVAMYLKNKVKVRPGDHVVLMYTHSEEFVFATHGCINLGAVVIPMAPLDQNRLNEDVPAFLHIVADYNVKAVLVNHEVDHLLKLKPVSSHLKQSAQILKIATPNVYNTTKPPKQNSGLRDLGLTIDPAWVRPGYPVVIWTYWTPDQRRIAVQLGHDTIMGMCKVQKETCQMTSSRPVLGCVRSTTGLGFVHTCLMGIYIGTPTYLLSPVEFAQNPMSLFVTLSRYKIKDTYATPQMLDHAMASMHAKGFTLHELKNMMITSDSRPRVDVFQKVRMHFAPAGLDRTAINTVYSHVLNPMIASRSYMCIEPIEIWLDTKALRRGLVVPVDPEAEPKALLVQDSGMVPVSTQIAIVNPENRMHCYDGEYGEIWVDSEACVKSFYGSKDAFDAERFDGRTVDGDPGVAYVRTGDLGFLHNVSRPIGPGGALVDMQVLFVLGSIGETFEINGLSHFPMDIETSVERSHRNIVPGGCAVFQAGGLVVVLVEVSRKPYLASIVPVIVNAILNEHQIIVDIVAFVSRGDFPRSRLGEKQRGKILAGWVTRKLRTLAQFAIRDLDASAMGEAGSGSGTGDLGDANRMSTGSIRSSGVPAGASSLRNVEHAPQILEQEEFDVQMNRMSHMPPPPAPGTASTTTHDDQVTPTGYSQDKSSNAQSQGTMNRDSGGQQGYFGNTQRYGDEYEDDEPPTVGPKPSSSAPENAPSAPKIRMTLPGVDGREGFQFWDGPQAEDDETDWTADAIMHMNLAGDMNPR